MHILKNSFEMITAGQHELQNLLCTKRVLMQNKEMSHTFLILSRCERKLEINTIC